MRLQMKIFDALQNAAEILARNGIEEPRREAASLLGFVIKKDRTFLIARDDYILTEAEAKSFAKIIERRASREPFQYITGRQEFYGLNFFVTPDVLIPRPETELIVENAVEILKNLENPRFCEIGTGSGCIAVSILRGVEAATAVGLDISEKALRISAGNAAYHNVAERLRLEKSDVFSALQDETFDLIVSNPPYIPAADIADLQPEVKDFEPLNALTDGKNGLSIVEKIISESPRFLKPQNYLLMEIGFEQAREISAKFDRAIWEKVEYLYDLQGIARTVKALLR